MKTNMKWILLPALSLAMAACSAKTVEQDLPEEVAVEHSSFSAYMINPTGEDAVAVRTGYNIDLEGKKAVFSWLEGDEVDAVVDLGNSYTGIRYVSQEAGERVRFKDGQNPNELTLLALIDKNPGAKLAPWAFYPSRGDTEAQDKGYGIDWDIRPNFYEEDLAKYPGETELITVTVPAEVTPPMANPLTVVPMFGKMDSEGEYAFTPMTAVLAIPVKNLTAEMDFVSIESEDAFLSGSFHVVRGETAGWITQASVVAGEHKQTLHFSAIEGDATFYFPIPAGTIPAGLTLKVGESKNVDNVMTISTQKALTLQTGHITMSPALTFAPADQLWEYYADATYIDDFIWSKHEAYTNGTPVPVTVERSGLHPEKFRINNPYTVANAKFGYTPYAEVIESDPYFVFMIKDGVLSYSTFKTGVEDADESGDGRVMILNYRSSCAANTYVVSSLSDGSPVELLFGTYFTAVNPKSSGHYYTRDGSTNQPIHLYIDQPERWIFVAEGTYKDNFIINNRWGKPVDTTVPVEIYKNSHTGKYRIDNPYPALAEAVSYKIPEAYTTAVDPYITMAVDEEGFVTFDEFRPGVGDTSRELAICHPADWNAKNGDNKSVEKNKILGRNTNGTPTAIQLAPIYHEPNNYAKYGESGNYHYSRDTYEDIIVLQFPQETWTSLGIGRYTDEWLWTANGFAPYDVEVEVWRSDSDPNSYRVANPYSVANTAFKRTAADGDADEYLYLHVDPSNGQVSFGSLVTGMTRTNNSQVEKDYGDVVANWVLADQAVSSSLLGKSIEASRVVAGSAAAPETIRLYSAYYSNTEATYLYSNSTGYKYLWFPGAYYSGETWSDFCEGTYQDAVYDIKINNSSATPTLGVVPVMIQRSDLKANRYRIANPYRPNVDASLRYETYDEYLYFVVENGLVYFEPFNTGIVFDSTPKELGFVHATFVNTHSLSAKLETAMMTNSLVKATSSDGSPKSIEIGAFYYDVATPNYGYNYPRHNDTQYPGERIFIEFSDIGNMAVITPRQYPMIPNFHNPVEILSLPTGTLERVTVKVTGLPAEDLSKIGLRLYQYGWMNADSEGVDGYLTPDADGVVTMTGFNQDIQADIDLNVWIRESIVGAHSIRFIIQEVVVDGVSLPIEQDTSLAHYAGIVVNTGGDVVNVRGANETVSAFRIPALVTSNDGTLIAAYDIRYAHSGDLVADIDVGVKRSTDGGKTWGPLIKAMDMGEYGGLDQRQNGIGDPCLLVDENTGDIFCFAVWAHGHGNDADTRSLAYAGKGFAIEDTPQFMMVVSTDDGQTWSDPINLTRQVKQYDWRMSFQGPGRGITMKDGTLVIPFQHQEGEEKNMHGLYPLNSGIAYSTDHGLTWHVHNFAHPITSECTVAEIAPGKLLLSMRDETDSHARRNFVTTDLGRTWTAHSSNGKWLDSTCEASMIHVDASKNSSGKDLVLLSNPNNTSRSRMSIRTSIDQAESFGKVVLIDEGGSWGYSCLTMVDESTVGVLYESSRGNMVFQAIPLADLVP